MSPDKQRSLATAVGFLSGLLACLHALRDRKILWPPDVVWRSLQGPQRIELGGGIILVAVALIVWIARQRRAETRWQ